MILEGRENIAKYLYMSNATLGRHLRKDGIPYMWAETRDSRGRRCSICGRELRKDER